jgi:hypothetical protein
MKNIYQNGHNDRSCEVFEVSPGSGRKVRREVQASENELFEVEISAVQKQSNHS